MSSTTASPGPLAHRPMGHLSVLDGLRGMATVSYTHLTLPTNREV